MPDKTPVYIKEVSITDFKCFRGENKFLFVDANGDWCRWTVFLGNNNAGKTNLLKAIASLEPEELTKNDDSQSKKQYFPLGHFENISPDEATLALDIFPPQDKAKDIHFYEENGVKPYDFLYFSDFAIGQDDPLYKNLSIYGYGVVRDIESRGIAFSNTEELNANNLFYNTKLINFEDWLFQLDYAAKNKQKQAAIRRELLKKILTSEIFPEISDIRFVSDQKLNNYIEFKATDGWHKLNELGYGYQATLSWMMDFCKKMFDRYPESSNPLKEPAVILIDEIDLHLHPQWQRTLIKYLSDIFSATQFIVTTHSPFIVQSMENVNLYTLTRDKDHTEVKHLGHKSFVGWRIEEILGEVMGLDKDIQTDIYQSLSDKFDKALDDDNYSQAKEAYDGLMKILHPKSPERKLLDIQLSQMMPKDD